MTKAGTETETVSKPLSAYLMTVACSFSDLDLAGEGGLRPTEQGREDWLVWFLSSLMACLPRMTNPGCSLSTMALSDSAPANG